MQKKTLDIPSPYYRVSLKAIILDDQKRMVVVQTGDGFWELPGGGWEHEESMQHCLRREVMEELGIGVDEIDFTNIYPYGAKGRSGNMRLKLAIPVTITDYDFTMGDDIIDVQRVTSSELAQLDMVDTEVGIKAHIDRIWAAS